MLNNFTPPNTSYIHDIDNRLFKASSVSFGYDNNGNLIAGTLGGNVTNYSWDFVDMLTQVTKDGNAYAYRYDGLGERGTALFLRNILMTAGMGFKLENGKEHSA